MNSTEWRDVPLIAAAATVAGLLLFGERNASNALKSGEQDAIAGIGFGAAAFSAFANYLSPQKARDLLRQGARGHFCLATQGELILSVFNNVQRSEQRNELDQLVKLLTGRINSQNNTFARLEDAKSIRDAASKAIAVYDLQVRQLDTAGTAIGESAWNFGIDLMTRTDRSEQKVSDLVAAITAQTQSITKFSMTEQAVADPVPKAMVAGLVADQEASGLTPTDDELANAVAGKTSGLVDGLVNVEALVLGFDKCTSTALAGGTPKADRIQRVAIQ